MRRMLVLGIAVSLSCVPAFADSLDDAFEAAHEVCGELFGRSKIEECMNVVSSATFIQKEAVDVCKGQFGSDAIIQCMGAIVDRKFTDKAIEVCGESFGSQAVISCFRKSGRNMAAPAEGSVDKSFVIRSMRKAIQLIQQGDSQKAISLLEVTIDSL